MRYQEHVMAKEDQLLQRQGLNTFDFVSSQEKDIRSPALKSSSRALNIARWGACQAGPAGAGVSWSSCRRCRCGLENCVTVLRF